MSATSRLPRRQLRFDRLAELSADVDQLATAEQQAGLKQLGNWTFGQTLGHLSAWMNFGFDGVPLKIPFFVVWMIRPMKSRTLNKPMSPGRTIPSVPGGTLGTELISTDEGLKRMRAAIERLSLSCPDLPSPLFGKMSHEEWIKLNLRHAELHLSFLIPS